MQLKHGILLQGGKYRIEEVLGQGGFGITYIANQTGLDRKVAVKEFFMKDSCERDERTSHVLVPTASNRELVRIFKNKFIREARMIAGLDNEHIVKVYDVFEENDTAYYVMEYLDGGSLNSKIKNNGAMPESEAVNFIYQIADALLYLHSHNILHLDVKPSNILLGKNDKVKLIDFGISKHYDEGGLQTSSTPVGISKGFAPLEQYPHDSDIKSFTPATDIYSLGATLYALLSGSNPPEASVVNEDGIPTIEGISPTIMNAVEKAMQPIRKYRPQGIAEFLNLLPSFLDDEETIHEGHSTKIIRSKFQTLLTLTNISNLPKWIWLIVLFLMILCCLLLMVKPHYMTPEEMYQEGEHYYYGTDGKSLDYSRAVEWYRKAAEKGNSNAQYNLGNCYRDGTGVTQSYETAVEWYRKAAENGDAEAQCVLGYYYHEGIGVVQNDVTAAEWYRKAAEQGNADAQCALGYCYIKGKGVVQDDETAVEWYRKAAKQGNSAAQFGLGICYRDGTGVTQSYETAVEWYRKAADNGDSDAQCELGNCYSEGTGVTQNDKTAAEWYRKAADNGNSDAQYNLANCYRDGTGVSQSYETTVEWYRKAADQGNDYAQNNLGMCYETGTGVTQNDKTAVEWFRKAAEHGNAIAQYNLGRCYKIGFGVEKNLLEAQKWFQKAAEQGHKQATIQVNTTK